MPFYYTSQNILRNFGTFWSILAFLTKISGNSSLIKLNCKQREEINIWKLPFDDFFIFSQLESFDFFSGSPRQNVNKYGLKSQSSFGHIFETSEDRRN